MPCSDASRPDQGEQREHRRDLVADDRAEAVEQRFARDAGRLGADHAGVEEQHEQAGDDQCAASPEAGLRDVA